MLQSAIPADTKIPFPFRLGFLFDKILIKMIQARRRNSQRKNKQM